MDHLTAPLLPRSVVSDLTGVPSRTLVLWDRLGLLGRALLARPRFYSWQEVEWIQRTAFLMTQQGLPLEEVRRLLRNGGGRSAPWRVRAAPVRGAAARPRRALREGVPRPRGHHAR